ncbi:FAD dependent oxidoreductase [Macroventuria anomochaeta]|uniref:FAD dependent oxidoreductase n=1 Tax=Macroventuria anomochaeta TaxID=301207 RepID=A0ACB6SAL7_9PLEO|nr:FAD dependent oxidoreductase [Macroventuria anomochaeta]KAF2631099.1 FAD dependent oxidoreductase [Macroventuria anomochaeta]
MEDRARIPVSPPVADPVPSYWHDPESSLTNINHGQDDSHEPYDYVIIGSGISGTMIAYNLLKKNPKYRIMMLEAREICSGATGRNGGHTKAASYRSYLQHAEELGKEEALKIARLEYDNIVETHRLAEELGIDCENKLCKTVDIIYDKPTFELGKMAIQALRADVQDEEKEAGKMAWYNIRENIETVSEHFRVSAKNENPVVEDKETVAGAFEYIAGRVHAYRFTTGVLAECIKMGLQICTNTPVLEIEPSRDIADFLWDISTQNDTFIARNLILATNGYTPFLERSLQGAIVPLRGQITAQKSGKASKLSVPLPTTFSFIYKSGYEYMIPRPLPGGGQHIVIGGGLGRLPEAGASEFGTVDDSSLNPEISKYLHGSLAGYFGSTNWGEISNEEASNRVVQEWTGIMGATADGRPFVGKVPGKMDYRNLPEYDGPKEDVPLRNLWISAGFNGHGMVLCLKSAEALVKMIENDGMGWTNDGPGNVDGLDWFPKSFLISEDRLKRCQFKGRTDLLPKE